MAIEKVIKALREPLEELGIPQELPLIENHLHRLEKEGTSRDDLVLFCRKLLNRRKKGEPLAYILGETVFRGLTISCGPGVFVPQKSSEEFAEIALDPQYRQLLPRTYKILDIGAGTGAIGLSILAELKKVPRIPNPVELVGVENNVEAFAYLEKNYVNYRDVFAPFTLTAVQGSWYDCIVPQFEKQFDLVVAYPPFISASQWEELPDTTKKFEQKSAYVHKTSLDDHHAVTSYMEILEVASALLKKGGRGILQMGEQADELMKILPKDASFAYPRIHFDSDKNKRFITFKKK